MQPIWRILITPILRNISKSPWFSLYIYISISLFVYLTICLVAAANLKDSYISLSFSLNVSVSLFVYLSTRLVAAANLQDTNQAYSYVSIYLPLFFIFISFYLIIFLYLSLYIYLYLYLCILYTCQLAWRIRITPILLYLYPPLSSFTLYILLSLYLYFVYLPICLTVAFILQVYLFSGIYLLYNPLFIFIYLYLCISICVQYLSISLFVAASRKDSYHSYS